MREADYRSLHIKHVNSKHTQTILEATGTIQGKAVSSLKTKVKCLLDVSQTPSVILSLLGRAHSLLWSHWGGPFSFTKQMFTECLLCARSCSRQGSINTGWERKTLSGGAGFLAGKTQRTNCKVSPSLTLQIQNAHRRGSVFLVSTGVSDCPYLYLLFKTQKPSRFREHTAQGRRQDCDTSS